MRYRIYRTRDWLGRQRWRWRLVAANNEILASGESYANHGDCAHAVRLVQSSLSATIEDQIYEGESAV